MHRDLGQLNWNYCGMARTREGLSEALNKVVQLREAFWNDVRVLGDGRSINQALEHAGRVADFMEFTELMIRDALKREESCGGHFREEYQSAEGEAKRDDANFCHVAAWEHQGEGKAHERHTEELTFDHVQLSTRSYK